ncbi:MAG: ABC transporter ATP-binding protein [Bacteroidota bacterium]
MLSDIRRINQVLTSRERKKIYFLALVMMGMGAFDIIGIVSVLPLIQLITSPGVVNGDGFIAQFYHNYGFESHRELVKFAAFGSLALIVFSNFFRWFSEWFKFKTIWNLAHRLSMSLFGAYLKKPYVFYLNTNSSEATTYIISEAANISKGIIVPLVELLGRLSMITIILCLLLWVDVSIALIMFGSLGLAYVVIYMYQRQRLSNLGETRIKANTLRLRSLAEFFSGIKTLRVHNRQRLFFNQYRGASKTFTSIQPKYHLTVVTPRFILEILAFGSLIGIILYLFLERGATSEIIPTLGLYAVAGYRLIPSLQSAFTSVATLRNNWPSFDRVYDALAAQQYAVAESDEEHLSIRFERQVEVKNLSFTYPSSEQAALTNINFTLKTGETIALVGSTGSGKTTLVDLLVGLLAVEDGIILIDDTPLTNEITAAWQKHLAYVPQDVFLFDSSIACNIALSDQVEDTRIPEVEEAAALAGIHEFISELPDGYRTEIGERGVRLSGGQKQRLGLARALFRNPSVLILDEATSALDSITEKGIVDALSDLPKEITTIIIAHRLSTVKRADRIYLLKKGRVVDQGSYDELLEKNVLFQEMVQAT